MPAQNLDVAEVLRDAVQVQDPPPQNEAPAYLAAAGKNPVRDWSLLIPRTGVEGNIFFF